jgi:NADP-dependent 3-hydroxy acid dehydrogenase YdfG
LGTTSATLRLPPRYRTWRKKSLAPDAITRAIRFALEQPAGVDINEVIVRPTEAGM